MRGPRPAAAALALLVAAGGVARADRLDDALARARREDRAVVLEFGATWCGPCRLFEQYVLANPLVRADLRRRIFIRLDVDAPLGQELAQRYKVVVIPTFVSLDPTGEVLQRATGILDVISPRAFIAFFERAETWRTYRKRAADPRIARFVAGEISRVRRAPGSAAAGWALARAALAGRMTEEERSALFALHARSTTSERQLAFAIYAALAAGSPADAATVADVLVDLDPMDSAALAAAGHAYAAANRLREAKQMWSRCKEGARVRREELTCRAVQLHVILRIEPAAVELVRHAISLRVLAELDEETGDVAFAERAADQAVWGLLPDPRQALARVNQRYPGTLGLRRGLVATVLGVRSDAGLSGDGRFQVDGRALVAFTRGFDVKPLLLAAASVGIDFADEVAYEGAAEAGFAAAGGLIGIYSGILASDHGAGSDAALGIPIELAVFFPGKQLGIEAFVRTTILFAGDEARRTGSNDAPLGSDELSLGLAARVPGLGLPLQVGIRHDQLLDTTLTGLWLGVELVP
jgi:thiol-disulfide isomerase/thioredoxin